MKSSLAVGAEGTFTWDRGFDTLLVARKGIRRDQHSRDTRTSESLSTPSIHSLPPQPF